MTASRELVFAARTDCERLAYLTSWGTSGSKAVKDFTEDPDPEPVSPFAAMIGNQFERRITSDNAEALNALYAEAVGVGVSTVVTIASTNTRDRDHVDQQAIADTLAVLNADNQPGTLVYQANVIANVAGNDHVIKPDLVHWDGNQWRVGEIKAYLVESGFEDRFRLASAVAQAAFGAMAIKRTGVAVADIVDVFRHDRFTKPVHTSAVIGIWADHMASYDTTAAHIREQSEPPTSIDDILAVEHTYHPSCENYCGLAARCRPQ